MKLAGGIAVIFGILTVISGGIVLFTDGSAHQSAGNFVPFVVWFNFITGFIYILAGAGLSRRKRWVIPLSFGLLMAILVVFSVLGIHILQGGAYETRTLAAMSFRAFFWLVIILVARVKIQGSNE